MSDGVFSIIGSTFTATVPTFYDLPDSNTTYNSWGNGAPPAGGGAGAPGGPRPAPASPAVADPNTGRVPRGLALDLVGQLGDRFTDRGVPKTAADLLAGLASYLDGAHRTGKHAAGGYRTPSLRLPDGSEVRFASDEALRAYLQRSASPAISAEQVDALHRAVLGRGADPGQVESAQAALDRGRSPDDLRRELAASPEARAAVGDLFRRVLGRGASEAELAGFQAALARGDTLDGVRGILAHSPELREDVRGFYRRGLGREAGEGELSARADGLARGGTLEGVWAEVARSPEAAAGLQAAFRAELGRAPDAAAVGWMRDALAGGGSIAGLRREIARSPEAASGLQAAFQAVLGRAPDGAALGWMQDILARGGSRTDIGFTLAMSDEADKVAITDGTMVYLVGNDGTPGNNQAQNKQFRDVVKALRLSKDQSRMLHESISGENMSYQELLEEARAMFGK